MPTPKQCVKLLFYPHVDSVAAATPQPSWTDDSLPSSGIIPGKSGFLPPVSQEDARLQILFSLLLILNKKLFGPIRFSKVM